MTNPKTTIIGYLTIAAALITLAIKLLQGNPITLEEITALIAAFGGGAAAVNAKDGSH